MTWEAGIKEGIRKNIKEAFIYSQILDRTSARGRRLYRLGKRGRGSINGDKSLEE